MVGAIVGAICGRRTGDTLGRRSSMLVDTASGSSRNATATVGKTTATTPMNILEIPMPEPPAGHPTT
jgi:hypothetical protein